MFEHDLAWLVGLLFYVKVLIYIFMYICVCVWKKKFYVCVCGSAMYVEEKNEGEKTKDMNACMHTRTNEILIFTKDEEPITSANR